MKTISRYIMTLALLLTAVTGAWADGTVTVKELTASEITAWANDENPLTAADLPGFVEATTEQAQSWDGYPTNGIVYLIYGFDNGETKKITYYSGNAMTPSQDSKTRAGVYGDINRPTPDRYFYVTGIEAPLTVTWNASTKTGSFVMPAYDVEIAPIYAPVAQWAEVETVKQLPTAIEGIIAGEAKDIVKAGTVATTKIGEADPIAQGTVMYVVTTENKKPTSTTGFSATVPTGAVLTGSYTENQTVYVWYYIKGIDAAEGETASAENTFNDSEICTTPLTVTVLSNKFDIQLSAANANTIEAGKATVTVGGTDKTATVTDGKLQGVKMGSEVKLEAKPGYKFRKVEVKKGAAGVKVTAITLNKTATTITAGQTETLSVSSVTPDDATDQTVTWSSDNEAVATVDADGKVTAVALGTANITATANDGSGVTATCVVTVNKVVTINQSDWGSGYVPSFTKDGVTVSADMIDPEDGYLMNGGTFSTTLGNFTKIVVTASYCNASGTGWSSRGSSQTWAGTPASTVSFSGEFMGRGRTQTTIVCTIVPAN